MNVRSITAIVARLDPDVIGVVMGLSASVSLLLAAIASVQASGSLPDKPFNFQNSYGVWAQGNDGVCRYIIGDVFVSPADLRKALASYQQKDRGVEFVITRKTPSKCVARFERAARKAGFEHYRTRLAINQTGRVRLR